MGNQLAVSGSVASINIRDISPSLQHDKPLGGRRRGRLFTSLRCTESGRDVVVKVFIRNFLDKEQNDLLARHEERLAATEDAIRKKFYAMNPTPPCNVLYYSSTVKLDRYCMLTRPFLHYSLPERLAIRPVLTLPQRCFLAFQLLRGLRQLHDDFDVVHGDLKAENVLITTAGWLYMTDLAPFKPSLIPSYNPANFEYYFDNAEQQLCCLAPERFVDEGAMPDDPFAARTTPAADVFAAGCIIAHLMSEEPLYQLSGILEFRSKSRAEKEHMLQSTLHGRKIPQNIIDLCTAAMCPDASDRMSAAALIDYFTPSVFPRFFGMLYMNVLPAVMGLPPDLQVQYLWVRFDDIFRACQRCETDPPYAAAMARSPTVAAEKEEDEDDQKMKNDANNLPPPSNSVSSTSVVLDIIMPIICVAIRHVKTADSRVKALHLIRKATAECSDALKRDTLLPFALYYVRESTSPTLVRAIAIRALTSIIDGLQRFPNSECLMFEDLVLPSLADVAKDPRTLVRVEFARCLPRILNRALSYVEARQAMGQIFNWKASFDFQRHQVVERGWEMLKPLFTCKDSAVVVALLSALPVLAEVLGNERCTDDLLPLVVTLMGSPVVEVKRQMLASVIDLAALLKTSKSPATIAVCLEEGLRECDPEIIVTALRGIRRLCREKCLPASECIKLVQRSVFLLGYPDAFVAHEAALVTQECSMLLDQVDVLVHLVSPVRPLLQLPIPLGSLSTVESFLNPAASLAQSGVRRQSTLCVDYFSALKDRPDVICSPTNAQIRGAGDVPSDKVHVDVDEKCCEVIGANDEDSPWLMSAFHATARQRKRIQWRHWKPHSSEGPAVAHHPRGSRTVSAVQVPTAAHPQHYGGARTSSASPAMYSSSNAPPRQRRVDFVAQSSVMHPCAAPIAVSHEHEGPIYSISFLLGSLATCGSGGMLRIWDVDETIASQGANLLRPLVSKRIFPSNVSGLFVEYLNPAVVACGGSDGTLEFFNVETGTSTLSMKLDDGMSGGLSSCCSIGRTSPLIAVGTYRGIVSIIDERTKNIVWSSRVQKSPISTIVALGNNDYTDSYAIACGTLRGTVPLIDLRLRNVVQTFTVPSLGISGPCVHSIAKSLPVNGVPQLLVATSSADVIQFSLQTMKETMFFKPSTPHSIRTLLPVPRCPCFVSGGTDKLLRMWNVQNPEASFTVCCSPLKSPKYTVSTVDDCTTVAEAPSSSSGPALPPVHADNITALAAVVVSQQMYLASGSRDGCLRIWHNISTEGQQHPK